VSLAHYDQCRSEALVEDQPEGIRVHCSACGAHVQIDFKADA
jgi:hypothetical protein